MRAEAAGDAGPWRQQAIMQMYQVIERGRSMDFMQTEIVRFLMKK